MSHFSSNLVKLKREGFTLVELLIVIAIIALLAAILFPAFSKRAAFVVSIEFEANRSQHHAISTRLRRTYPSVYYANYAPINFYDYSAGDNKADEQAYAASVVQRHLNFINACDGHVKTRKTEDFSLPKP